LNSLGYNPAPNVFSGEDGGFKAATVLLRFEKPSALTLLERATPLTEALLCAPI